MKDKKVDDAEEKIIEMKEVIESLIIRHEDKKCKLTIACTGCGYLNQLTRSTCIECGRDLF